MMESDVHFFQYESHQSRQGGERLKSVWLSTGVLIEALQNRDTAPGFCMGCGCVVDMGVRALDWDNTREGIACETCGFSARLRVSMHVLGIFAKRESEVYITEQCTPLYAWMQSHYPNIRGSEFEPDAESAQSSPLPLKRWGHGEVRYQDVTSLSFADASLGLVLSGDVLEHLPGPGLALLEFARVLRGDGMLIATFPFNDKAGSVVRATLVDGRLVHHAPPEYHGDPISGGVLCFRYFGWDVPDMAAAAGFRECRMAMTWAPEACIFYGHWMLLARKPRSALQEVT